MDEYISREEVINITAETGAWETQNRVRELPAADVQPVKHGRWVKHRIDDPKSILHGAVKDTTCSVCGKSTPYNTEYCMHCGARMDGDSE